MTGPSPSSASSARHASGSSRHVEPGPWSYVDAVSDATLGRRFKRWFWRPPRPHGETIAGRTVSFLELFYDLVYVGGHLPGRPSPHRARHGSRRRGLRGRLRLDLDGLGQRIALPRAPRPRGRQDPHDRLRRDGRARPAGGLHRRRRRAGGRGFALVYAMFLAISTWLWNSVRRQDRRDHPEFLAVTVNSPKRSTSDSVGGRPRFKPTSERPTSTMPAIQATTTIAHTTSRGPDREERAGEHHDRSRAHGRHIAPDPHRTHTRRRRPPRDRVPPARCGTGRGCSRRPRRRRRPPGAVAPRLAARGHPLGAVVLRRQPVPARRRLGRGHVSRRTEAYAQPYRRGSGRCYRLQQDFRAPSAGFEPATHGLGNRRSIP